jgi:hypothetical protein
VPVENVSPILAPDKSPDAGASGAFCSAGRCPARAVLERLCRRRPARDDVFPGKAADDRTSCAPTRSGPTPTARRSCRPRARPMKAARPAVRGRHRPPAREAGAAVVAAGNPDRRHRHAARHAARHRHRTSAPTRRSAPASSSCAWPAPSPGARQARPGQRTHRDRARQRAAREFTLEQMHRACPPLDGPRPRRRLPDVEVSHGGALGLRKRSSTAARATRSA